jgi:bifunctional oligoribonuclease and PAP phosphatase NrnA
VSRDRARILALLRGGSRFLITSHVNPDGDSVASQCALRLLIERLGGRAAIVNSQPPPRVYRFLPGASRFGSRRPRSWKPYAALLVLDCGDARRASGLLEPRPPVPVVNIDHHVSNPGFGDLNLVDPAACSTAEIIHGLAVALGVRPEGALAESLYTGILTDTGSFRHGNATPRAFRIASRLVGAGIDPARIAQAVYQSVPYETLRALGETLAGLRRTPDGRVAWIRLPLPVLDRLDSAAESEEWAGYPRSLDTAVLAICFKETAPGQVRLSFRSKGAVDVAALAARWGGGGHRNAAGATAQGTLDAVERSVIAAAVRHLGPIRAGRRPRGQNARGPTPGAHPGR